MGKIPSLEDCNPGLVPVEFNVVVYPEDTEEVTKGGIILTHGIKEVNDLASQNGRLVAVSPLAFTYDEWPDGSRKPEVGDAVLFAKYAGVLVEAADGKEVRVLKDKDIIAIIEEAPAESAKVAALAA